jgi:predicted nucleic acid-binding protein
MNLMLLDTSIYITLLRSGDLSVLYARNFIPHATIWMSAIVIEELHVGAQSTVELKAVEALEKQFRKVDRFLTPNLTDWIRSGRVLKQIGMKYGFENVRQAKMINDALLAISAGRTGITVLTKNDKDFKLLAEFFPFRYISV